MSPNPTEYYPHNFDKNTLVPVFVGMDFLGPSSVGMILDFSTGLAMNTTDQSPEIYKLHTNCREHCVIGSEQHLTIIRASESREDLIKAFSERWHGTVGCKM